jgi:hypothetical protein
MSNPDVDQRNIDDNSPSDSSFMMRHQNFQEELESKSPRMRGWFLNWAIAFVAGTGFTLFGFVFKVILSTTEHY